MDFLLAFAVVLLGVHLASVALVLARRAPRRPPAAAGTPHVTLLRPVCGSDPFDEETLATSFVQTYPSYDVIFCAPSPTDPSVPLVRRLIAQNPAIRAELLVGEARISANPKLNNVFKGWQASGSDWICMTDSNLRLGPDYLRQVVESWQPDTGMVSSPPVGERPQNWGGHIECAILNANQARLQLAADSLGRGFAQGKTLFFHRPTLERAGGFTALGSLMAEDAAATRLIRGLGLKVTLLPLPHAQPIGERSLRQVWDRQLRWARVRRDGFPLLFAAEVLNGALPPAVMALAGGASAASVAGGLALWYLAETVLMVRLRWPHGWRDVMALPLRDVLLPALWVAAYARRGFEWRGTAMGQSADA